MNSELKDRFKQYIPGISLDCVLLGYQNRRLHVLLLKYKNVDAWSLPGGFLPKDVEMDEIVGSILENRTGVKNIFLEQFYTFSSISRGWDCNELSKITLNSVMSNWEGEDRKFFADWFGLRFLSTAYFALVNANQVNAKPDNLSDRCEWVPIDELPPLVLDHGIIINKSREYLRKQINYLPVGRELLEPKFTIVELQSLYEAILGKKLDRGNFQRKIMKLNMLVRHEKLMTGAQNKAPYLYSMDNDVYNELLEQGIGF